MSVEEFGGFLYMLTVIPHVESDCGIESLRSLWTTVIVFGRLRLTLFILNFIVPLRG